MKKPILAFVVLLGIACGAWRHVNIVFNTGGAGGCTGGGSTPTIVQGASMLKSVSSATQAITTSSGAVAAGHQLFVMSWCSSGSLTSSVADLCTGGGSSQTGLWNNIEHDISATPAGGEWSIFGVASANACTGTDTITVTYGGTCAIVAATVAETTNTSITVDQGPSGASGYTSGSVTNLFANELLLSPVLGGNGNAAPTIPAGWTTLGTNAAGSTNPGFAGNPVSACAAQQAVWTCAGCGTTQTSIVTMKHN